MIFAVNNFTFHAPVYVERDRLMKRLKFLSQNSFVQEVVYESVYSTWVDVEFTESRSLPT
jgi:hypothetical protein